MTKRGMGRPSEGADPNEQHRQFTASASIDSSTEAQRARTLEALRGGPKSTIELRRYWDILSPAPRIKELRDKQGCSILTNWVHHPTDCGKIHRVAHYVLVSEEPSGKAVLGASCG